MNSQHTPQAIIDHEKGIVQKLLGLPATAVTLRDDGWDSRVYEASDNCFFKFPRSEKIRGRYAAEIAALELAATISGVDIPVVKWRHPANDYFGYRGIAGKTLSTAAPACSAAERQAAGAVLGSFLKQFHRLKLDGAREVDLEREIAQLHEWFAACTAFIETHCPPDESKRIASLVHTTWPNELRALGRDAALCHGDFHSGNVIVADDGSLGVIDFGDVGYYDRSKDFVGLQEPDILAATLDAYGRTEALERKIALRRKIWCVIQLTACLGKGDERAAAEKLSQLRSFAA